MRLLFVVQRYGADIAGGAEQACRMFAERFAAAGHEVTAVSTCARNYTDWANELPEGESELNGVRVLREPVARRRDPELFGPLYQRVLGRPTAPQALQREWVRMQGPWSPALIERLMAEAPAHDAAIFFTYLYWPSWAGLRSMSGTIPTVLHPCAHDEPPLYLPVFDELFDHADAFAYFTEEEQNLVVDRFGNGRPSIITGIGMDLDVEGDANRFRAAHGVTDPYVLFLGRVDPGKGSTEIYDFFTAYKRRNPDPLKLVIMGDPVLRPEDHPDIVITGFVDDQMKQDGLAGTLALVQPSYFESFSMALTECWSHRRPALVQGRCDVLRGQAERSQGAIPYEGYAEFEAALDLLVADPDLAAAMGQSGRRYVEERYEWGSLIPRYEQFLADLVGSR
ncbi:MAG: glycosyltransferase family 4 protein [Actinomycetia bacterium]|nr:glycosyltransferase family 4 protein [Actinomycetes bacterium]